MTIHVGDCLTVLPTLPHDSVDAIVTDPPYGLSFMGKDWDHGVPGTHFWAEMLRVAKPGAHLVAFGGTRTFHRMTCAIEDAGWEIRDCLMWLYGSGFPKSHDVSKALDKTAGQTRSRHERPAFGGTFRDDNGTTYGTVVSADPVTQLAKQWQGWGTALKPAWEPIILARNPLQGTVAENVARYGTGCINVDACRVATDEIGAKRDTAKRQNRESWWMHGSTNGYGASSPAGRWPANLILDEQTSKMLDRQAPETGAFARVTGNQESKTGSSGIYGRYDAVMGVFHGDHRGGASRFFYCSKSSRSERHAGAQVNNHPTVKPLLLMRWLCRLVTPAKGTILDPFMGSGSTGCAAALEGMGFIGIEQDDNYAAVAKSRIDHWAAMTPAQLALEFSDDEAAA